MPGSMTKPPFRDIARSILALLVVAAAAMAVVDGSAVHPGRSAVASVSSHASDHARHGHATRDLQAGAGHVHGGAGCGPVLCSGAILTDVARPAGLSLRQERTRIVGRASVGRPSEPPYKPPKAA